MEGLLSAFSEPILRALPRLPQAILALAVGYLVLKFLKWVLEKSLRWVKAPRSLVDIINSIAGVVLWVILIAVVFQSLGLNQVALAFSGSVAILAVAVGAGANALVQDIIAGLFLARDRDFDVGYRIKTADIEGVIRRIDVRKVRIEDDDGRISVLPTSTFDRSNWMVLARDDAPAISRAANQSKSGGPKDKKRR